MLKLYRVKLNPGHEPAQEIDGYLAFLGEIQVYTRYEAIKKARAFGGKIEVCSSNSRSPRRRRVR